MSSPTFVFVLTLSGGLCVITGTLHSAKSGLLRGTSLGGHIGRIYICHEIYFATRFSVLCISTKHGVGFPIHFGMNKSILERGPVPRILVGHPIIRNNALK